MAPASTKLDDTPTLPAPDIPGMAHRKDYNAACPDQHLAWLKCIRDTNALKLSACKEEQEHLAACVNAAKPAHLQAGSATAAWNYWQQLKQDPTVLEVVDQVKAAAARLGLGINSKPSSSGS